MAGLTTPFSQRDFLKACGLALAAAGAGQVVVPPKSAFAGEIGTPDAYLATGKLGIGTADPQQKLHVSGTGHTAIVRIESDGYGYPYLQLFAGTNYFQLFHRNTNPAQLVTEYSGVELAALTSGNRLGIGTAAPLARLHVASNLHAEQYGAALLDGALALVWGTGVPNPPAYTAVVWHESGNPSSVRFKFPNGAIPLVISEDGTVTVGAGGVLKVGTRTVANANGCVYA